LNGHHPIVVLIVVFIQIRLFLSPGKHKKRTIHKDMVGASKAAATVCLCGSCTRKTRPIQRYFLENFGQGIPFPKCFSHLAIKEQT